MVTVRRILIRLSVPNALIAAYLKQEGQNWSKLFGELVVALKTLHWAQVIHVPPKLLTRVLNIPIGKIASPGMLLLHIHLA